MKYVKFVNGEVQVEILSAALFLNEFSKLSYNQASVLLSYNIKSYGKRVPTFRFSVIVSIHWSDP